jgi:GT2 family glycosyltransferase
VRYPPLVEWEWIVVDNASAHNDGQRLEEILKDIPQAHIIKLHHNLGFGGANKEGLQFSHGEIIAFINPDIEVQKDCFSELLPVLKNENIGILTPQLQTKEGKYLEHTWRFPTVWELMARRLFRHQSTPKIPTQIHSVAWAQGSFLIMKKSLFLSLGGFDDRFFLFFEDTDLCRRTWESGKKVVQIPTAKAIHSEHRLSGKDIFRSLLRKTFWIHVVSMIRYFWKWRGKPLPDIF